MALDATTRSKYNFVDSVTQLFKTDGEREFGVRLLFWYAAGLTLVNLIVLPMIVKHYPQFLDLNWENMQTMKAGEEPSVDNSLALLRIFGNMAGSFFLWMMGNWMCTAVSETALHRRNLLGAEYSKIPVRFGKTELNLMLVQLGVVALIFLFYILAVFAVSIGAGILGMASLALGVSVMFVGILGVIGFLSYISIRLAPAAALTVEQNELRMFSARPIAKGRFWSFFVSYLTIWIAGYVALNIVMYVFSLILVGNADAFVALMGMGAERPSVVFAAIEERLKNPLVMLSIVLGIVAYSATHAYMYISLSGVGSYALKLYRKDTPA